MANLLAETQDALQEAGVSNIDIVFIGSDDKKHSCSWDEFVSLAKNLNYDSGYGTQHIASDLVIELADGRYLSRDEYDGSEGWCLMGLPPTPKSSIPITNLGSPSTMWKSLENLNPAPKELPNA